MEADCRAGTLAQHDYLHPDEVYVAVMDVQWIYVSGDGKNRITRGDDVIVYENCENLNEIFNTMGIIS